MAKRRISRREFLSASALVAAGVVVSSCTPPQPTPEPTKAPAQSTVAPVATTSSATAVPPPTAVPAAPKEAPMLAELVKAGKLPPLEARLPKNPCVITPAEGIGKYGGGIRRGFNGVSDRWGPTKNVDHTLTFFNKDLTLRPHLVDSWETNEDASVWTWHLREGLKWSDGHDLTSDDFVWYYKYILTNKLITPGPGDKYCTRGTDGNKVVMEVTAPDKYTVVMKFAHPNPLFGYQTVREYFGFAAPGHYLKQYHMDLTDDKAKLEAEVKAAGFDAWNKYFADNRQYYYLNPDRPVWGPWRAVNTMSEQLFTMERNPYYFAVDPEGNQLPYLDKVTHRLFESPEVFNLWITNGEIDFQFRHTNMANYSLYKQGEQKGDYTVFLGKTSGHCALQPNHTTKNPKLREFFGDRRVRIAMSLAVDRDEMNELIYDGLYTPRQYSPLAMSPQYYEKLTKAYIEYDPDRANQLLDEAGFKKGADGYRLWKDGSGTISFNIEGTAEAGTPDEDAAQYVAEALGKVGIKCAYKYAERALYTEHYEANEIEAAWWGGDRTVVPLAPAAPIFRGVQLDRPWACAWCLWFNDPDDPNGEKPPEDHWIVKIWDIWSELAQTGDPKKQDQLFFQILDIWAEELPMIGYLGEIPAAIIVKNGFKGYLNGQALDDTIGDENFLNTETYYWEEPDKHTI